MNEQPLVLVADDDEDILTLVCIRLERAGLRVVAAHDGDEALRLARELKPRLAVLDLSMPRLGGLDVLGALREERADTRIVLLTAKAQEADVERGYAAGADAYLTKPFSPAKLVERVQALLGGT
jgi:DNA-binding response OmpR family regulator